MRVSLIPAFSGRTWIFRQRALRILAFVRRFKERHASLEQMKVPHLWHVDSGAHTSPVWKNDLFILAQRLFRDDDPGL